MKYLLILISLAVLMTNAYAEMGTIQGKVIDKASGEPLIGALIKVTNSSAAGITDIEGAYSIKVEPGLYSLVHTFIGYQKKTITQVQVQKKKPTQIGIIGLEPTSFQLSDVVVTYKRHLNSEEGLLNFQRNAANLVDAVSAQAITRSTDADVASIVKRIPGISIEGGKHVIVRGLGDRYSKSTLNGQEIPGANPEKNSLQMDIFSANIVDNIVIYKTFTPNLPGDFTGGMVDVVTKDFPNKKNIQLSVSAGYNSKATFADEFKLYNNAQNLTDILGLGLNNRTLPFATSFEANNADRNTLYDNTGSLNKFVRGISTINFLDNGLSLSYSNQVNWKNNYKVGIYTSVNFKNTYEYLPNFSRYNYEVTSNNSTNSLAYKPLQLRNGDVSQVTGLLNGMLNLALKNLDNKYVLKLLHIRSGEKTVSTRYNDDSENTQLQLETDLDYFQRIISNGNLAGMHSLNNRTIFNWANTTTLTTVNNPERNSTVFDVIGNKVFFNSGGSNRFNKEWRELRDLNNHFKADLTFTNSIIKDLHSKLKGGMSHIYKNRNYRNYTVSIGKSSNFSGLIKDGDLNTILSDENLANSKREGYTIDAVQIDKVNEYSAYLTIFAAYAMTDLAITEKLKFIGGLRVEHASMDYNGTERLTGNPLSENILNSTQILPSANLVYKLKNKMNLRLSYNKTVARPSFKEKSEAIIYDPITATFFNGNINLKETSINNFDMRYEYFLKNNGLVSFSAFYKHFNDPIEIKSTTTNDLKPTNKENATVYGLEVEARKSLGFISGVLDKFSLNTNFSLVKSETELSENEKGKYRINKLDLPTNRELVDQSPYMVNASLGYNHPGKGWESSLSYNVKGKTLHIVGIFNRPDIYEEEFHNLDFKVSKRWGEKMQSKLSLSVKNILNQNVNFTYSFPSLENFAYKSYDKGPVVSLSYSLSL